MEITLNVTLDEAKGMLALMGETPSKTGFFPLMVKISKQVESQVPEQEANKE